MLKTEVQDIAAVYDLVDQACYRDNAQQCHCSTTTNDSGTMMSEMCWLPDMTHQWQWVRLVSDVSDQSVPLDVTDDVTGDGSDDGSRELEVTGLTQQYKYNHNCCCQLILWYRSIWPCVTSFLLSASSSGTETRIAFKHMIRFYKQDETSIKIGKLFKFKNQKERKKLNFWYWRNACKEVMFNKTIVACKTSYF